MSGIIKVQRAYQGIEIDQPYVSGTVLKVEPCSYTMLSVGSDQQVKQPAIMCSFTVPFPAGATMELQNNRPVLLAVSDVVALVDACLSLIIDRPLKVIYNRSTLDDQNLSVQLELKDGWRFWRNFHVDYQLPAERIQISQEIASTWDRVLEELKPHKVLGPHWAVALRWLNKAAASESYHDVVIAGWTAFNALYEQMGEATEELAINRYVEAHLSAAFCTNFLQQYKVRVDELASYTTILERNGNQMTVLSNALHQSTTAGATPLNSRDSTSTTHEQAIMKAMLLVISRVRNSLLHGSWAYDEEKYQSEVDAAGVLLTAMLRRHLFNLLPGILPDLSFARTAESYDIDYSINCPDNSANKINPNLKAELKQMDIRHLMLN